MIFYNNLTSIFVSLECKKSLIILMAHRIANTFFKESYPYLLGKKTFDAIFSYSNIGCGGDQTYKIYCAFSMSSHCENSFLYSKRPFYCYKMNTRLSWCNEGWTEAYNKHITNSCFIMEILFCSSRSNIKNHSKSNFVKVSDGLVKQIWNLLANIFNICPRDFCHISNISIIFYWIFRVRNNFLSRFKLFKILYLSRILIFDTQHQPRGRVFFFLFYDNVQAFVSTLESIEEKRLH